MTFAEVENMTKGKSSHNIIIKAFYGNLHHVKGRKEDAQYFDRNVNRLKMNRIKADYGEKLIDASDSKMSYEIAKRIIKLIESNFLI